jgi:histidyl-tRNA synthetase
MRFASSTGTPYTIILGEEEIGRGTATLRDMESGEQREVPQENLASALRGDPPKGD